MFKKVPVLNFMTLTKIVRLLWSGYDVQNTMAEYFLEGDQTLEKWSSIEESLKLKIGKCFILPNELKIVLLSLVNPIGGRIKKIIQHMYRKDYLPSHFMSILSWTLLGTIDVKKTAEAVIKDDYLPITKRYEIACTYCLKDEILMLWRELPETNKEEYFNARGSDCLRLYIPIYWAYYMTVELNRLDRKIQEEYNAQLPSHFFGILCAGHITVNQPAVEYFLGKSSVEKREEYLECFFQSVTFRVVTDIYLCDLIYFLLAQLNENQRKSIFEKYAYRILNNFLEFPYGGIFLEIESLVQKYLTVDQVKDLEGRYKEMCRYFVFSTFDKNLRKLL
ncbi:ANK_REP_REGION domain-containing protein [Trichonephila clavata]|uniref:ANK_REP_REGION domain-containing protein n=1 Tax=Trichonephila clavata TaxID=2740835 RepID=A0A8X6JXS7_TRICU|nr:ANK_REP_REGION domain-containing protein [Trichonephila clavata]